MAKLYPPLQTIIQLRQRPTEGELFLIQELVNTCDDATEIYFQPFFNGERPDIVLMKKGHGLTVIEVKDWHLENYKIDKKNKWYVKNNSALIKSPFAQVFSYKSNFFNLHVNGLLEQKIANPDFYKTINAFVYFHNESKQSISAFYEEVLQGYREEILENTQLFKAGNKTHKQHEATYESLKYWKDKIERDVDRHSVRRDSLRKLCLPRNSDKRLFSDDVYRSFLRYLQPPFHTLTEGEEIVYNEKQQTLVNSRPEFLKIKGVAGSGKTTVLAKRAVNAHKRHGDRVLILTFNLTLRMYVKDMISAVREDFSWGVFDIINYHKFMGLALNTAGIQIHVPDALRNNSVARNEFLEEHYYSNLKILDGHSVECKYKTILIDEIQDYNPEWIRIIRKYFLEQDGEMVLFGDEKQNIYKREVADDKSSRTPRAFSSWVVLKDPVRYKINSPIVKLAKEFQDTFFDGKYQNDSTNPIQASLVGVDLSQYVEMKEFDAQFIASKILNIAKLNVISPNDIVLLSSEIEPLQEIDYLIRTAYNERTIASFEPKEFHSKKRSEEEVRLIRNSKKYGFNLNSGVVKIATVHSFKGYESPTVFLIVNDSDSAELVYVGLTRAKFNLVVFCASSCKYSFFFKSRLSPSDASSDLITGIKNELGTGEEMSQGLSLDDVQDIISCMRKRIAADYADTRLLE